MDRTGIRQCEPRETVGKCLTVSYVKEVKTAIKEYTMSEERISLDNIRTVEAWEVLKRLIGEQRENTTMPADIREVFFTADIDRLSEMSLSGNAVIAAVARTRMAYDGSAMDMAGHAGIVSVEPAQG
jgi:hypothetical protein